MSTLADDLHPDDEMSKHLALLEKSLTLPNTDTSDLTDTVVPLVAALLDLSDPSAGKLAPPGSCQDDKAERERLKVAREKGLRAHRILCEVSHMGMWMVGAESEGATTAVDNNRGRSQMSPNL